MSSWDFCRLLGMLHWNQPLLLNGSLHTAWDRGMELVLAHAHNTVLGSLLLTNLCQGLFVLCSDIKVAMLNTELGNKELFFLSTILKFCTRLQPQINKNEWEMVWRLLALRISSTLLICCPVGVGAISTWYIQPKSNKAFFWQLQVITLLHLLVFDWLHHMYTRREICWHDATRYVS